MKPGRSEYDIDYIVLELEFKKILSINAVPAQSCSLRILALKVFDLFRSRRKLTMLYRRSHQLLVERTR